MKNRKDLINEVDFALISQSIKVLSGKWRMCIILVLGEDTLRFGELGERIPAISEKVLSDELKTLVALGVVTRKPYAQIPPRVDYQLTPKGCLALPVLRQLVEIGRLFQVS